MADRIIYVDHAGTTPVHPEVAAAMRPYFTEQFGNPSSLHGLGAAGADAVDDARTAVAEALKARAGEIIFTSGGSESINTALKGVAFAQQFAGAGHRIVSTSIEHHAVLHTLDYLERFGFETVLVGVDSEGLVDPREVAAAVDGDTVLVSVMLANNEVGAVQPIAKIAQALSARGEALGRRIPFHTDGVQGAGQLALDVQALGVDLLSLSAHKFHGPKGAGALYLRRGTPFLAQQTGGGQERNRRAGTENVPGIVGMGQALRIAEAGREHFVTKVSALRDHFLNRTLREIPGAVLNGPSPERPSLERLPNNANVRFENVDGQLLLDALDAKGIAASSGSACTTSSWEPSHVLLAMGSDQDAAAGSLRITLGPDNTVEEMDFIVDQLIRIVPELRGDAVASEATGTPA